MAPQENAGGEIPLRLISTWPGSLHYPIIRIPNKPKLRAALAVTQRLCYQYTA